jgi:hypothetical protein
MDIGGMSPTKPAWRAKGESAEEHSSRGRIYTKEELIQDHAMAVIDWDGRTPRPVLDSVKRVIGVLAGRPAGDEWQGRVNVEATQALDSARERLHFKKEEIHHRRGPFPATDWGISFGGGQEVGPP